MTFLMKKIFALTLSLSLFVAPLAYAQEVSADLPAVEVAPDVVVTQPVTSIALASPATETPASESIPTTDPSTPDLQGTEGVQDTANTQPTIPSDTLEDTSNPETEITVETIVIPVEEAASSTPPEQELSGRDEAAADPLPVEEATSTLDIVAEDIGPEVKDEQPAQDPIPLVAEEVASVALADLTPDPEFTFSLTGRQIPSKRTFISREGKKVGEQTVTAPLVPQVDNATGVVSVSGQCSDVYFVVLLYRNQNDYLDDPSTYIVNRAFPCTNGSYSYAIADLPNNLANGQYYLLVGQQGERGAWTPITSLTEITINKN